MTLSPASALILFPTMIFLLDQGHRLRVRQKVEPKSSAIESAVFALFGLLLAFTFSGAISRYDAHRNLAVLETNDISTAYLRLDLLPANAQPELRRMFREYIDSRLHLYDGVTPEISEKTAQMQRQIWHEAVGAVSVPGTNPNARLFLTALNDMMEITAVRQNAFNMHPPIIVYLLLFVFSGCCAFMAGYGMSGTSRNWLYMLAFALAVTLTIYATPEIEYPRKGLIRLNHTDQNLLYLRDSMH